MIEIRNVRQIHGESRRRWFSSAHFDLIVWYSDTQVISGFELCYDKQRGEHALSWKEACGFQHMAVDDGEQRAGKYKAAPVLVPDGAFDVKRVHAQFARAGDSLPAEIYNLVLSKLEQHPDFTSRT